MTENKHAFLIGVFQNPDYLRHLIDSLDSSRSNIYVHVNKYNEDEFVALKNEMSNRPNVHFYSEIKVKYSGESFLESSQFLLKEAYKNEENSFFHFMTGQDILIKPLSELFDFLDKNPDLNYVDCRPYTSAWGDRRIYKHHLTELFKGGSKVGHFICRAVYGAEVILGINRQKWDFPSLHVGVICWSLSKDGAKTFVDYFGNEKNWKKLRYTFGVEEVIIPTLAYHSFGSNLVPKTLFYSDFSRGEDTHPGVLVQSDYNHLVESEYFFARKIHPKISKELIESLDSYTKRK